MHTVTEMPGTETMQQKSGLDERAPSLAFASARADAAMQRLRSRTYYRLELTFRDVGTVTALLSAEVSELSVDFEGLAWWHGEVVCAVDGSFAVGPVSLQRGLETAVMQSLRASEAGAVTFAGWPVAVAFSNAY